MLGAVCISLDNLWKLVLYFYHVGPGDGTQSTSQVRSSLCLNSLYVGVFGMQRLLRINHC